MYALSLAKQRKAWIQEAILQTTTQVTGFKGQAIRRGTPILYRNVKKSTPLVSHCLAIKTKLVLPSAQEFLPPNTSLLGFFFSRLFDPNQYSINCSGAVFKRNNTYIFELLCYLQLLLNIGWIFNKKGGWLFTASTTNQTEWCTSQ
jgi:hypothetical protein